MAHIKRFGEIPMSKAMRGICKEEDYAFLSNTDHGGKQLKDSKCGEDEWRQRQEERVRRRQEWEKKEQDRLRELHEIRKEKEQQWKEHVAKLAAEREATMKDRAVRLRDFRNFQRKVLEEEMGGDPRMGCGKIDELLLRM
ncbi:vicilin-like seed storage protein At2g18540 [Arapaima gigas]